MSESLLELQSQRDALKENLQDVDQNIKKLTGRDPAESRRLSTTRRLQLKRSSIGNASSNQPPEKRGVPERRRWGNTTLPRPNKLDSGGEEEEEEKKPAVHSSVVVTGKPIEAPKRTIIEDKTVKNRNRRMLGMLMGTLNQFKRESQSKSEQETKREEKLIKVEQDVQKEKEDAINERKQLYETRRTKQDELKKLEFKIGMAELNQELKAHYEQIKDYIQLKSTPRVFYKPAKHNSKTLKLLEESQELMKESLEQRMKEIEMCTEEDIATSRTGRRQSRVSKDVTVIEPVQSKRDLFAEDADNDIREREASASNKKDTDKAKKQSVDDDQVYVVDLNDRTNNDESLVDEGASKVVSDDDDLEVVKVVLKDDTQVESKTIISTENNVDSRHIISDQTSYDVIDERVIELSQNHSADDMIGGDGRKDDGEDDVNIYEDMQQDIELFQADDKMGI